MSVAVNGSLNVLTIMVVSGDVIDIRAVGLRILRDRNGECA